MEDTLNKVEKLLRDAIYYYGLDFAIMSSTSLSNIKYHQIVENYKNNFNDAKLDDRVYTLSYEYVYRIFEDNDLNYSDIAYYYERCENKSDYKYLSGFITFVSSKKLIK